MRIFGIDPYHTEWQEWANHQEMGENRPEAVRRMKECLSTSNSENNDVFLRLEGLGLTSLPETLPAGLTCLYASNNRLTRLPQNLPASLKWLDLHDNQFTTLPALPEGVFLLNAHLPLGKGAITTAPGTCQQPSPLSHPGTQNLTQEHPSMDAQPSLETEDAELERFAKELYSPSSSTPKGANETSPPPATGQQPPLLSDAGSQDLTQEITFDNTQAARDAEEEEHELHSLPSVTSEGLSDTSSQQISFYDVQAAKDSEEAELERLVSELPTSLAEEMLAHPLFRSDPAIQHIDQQIAELNGLIHELSTAWSPTSEDANQTSPPEETRRTPTQVSDLQNQYQTRHAAFIEAQAPVYERVIDELSNGRCPPRWIPIIFPQFVFPANSGMEKQFAISNTAEARAYLGHPVLGQRLRECAEIVTNWKGSTITDVFGKKGVQKLQASMTMFNLAIGEGADKVFGKCLKTHFNGHPHRPTLNALIHISSEMYKARK